MHISVRLLIVSRQSSQHAQISSSGLIILARRSGIDGSLYHLLLHAVFYDNPILWSPHPLWLSLIFPPGFLSPLFSTNMYNGILLICPNHSIIIPSLHLIHSLLRQLYISSFLILSFLITPGYVYEYIEREINLTVMNQRRPSTCLFPT